jgi:hypothetical protein
LQGAEKTLSENVLAVVLEVEFQPIYKGQKLFGEIQTFLSNHDFTFVRFLGIQEYSPHRASIGIRGNGFQCCADALFLRRCGSIDPHDKNGQIMLIKLAFFSILFNQTEYALLCLSMMDDLKWGDKQNNFESVGIKYLRFINELKYLKKGLNPCYPPTFPMKYSYEDSKRRFSKDNQRQTENNYGLAKRLGLYLFSKSALIKKIYFSVKATFILILKLPKITKKFLLQKGDTSIELLFRKYGLIEQADKIRSIRNKQQQYCTDKSAV